MDDIWICHKCDGVNQVASGWTCLNYDCSGHSFCTKCSKGRARGRRTRNHRCARSSSPIARTRRAAPHVDTDTISQPSDHSEVTLGSEDTIHVTDVPTNASHHDGVQDQPLRAQNGRRVDASRGWSCCKCNAFNNTALNTSGQCVGCLHQRCKIECKSIGGG